MALDARETAFVTGAAGFLGTELLKVLAERGHRVFGLAGSIEGARRVRRAGGVPVMGDVLEEGPWQDEAAAEWVFHLPPDPMDGPRLTRRAAERVARARVSMDGHVLDAVAGGPTRRIVYVSAANCYRAAGPRPITEDAATELSPLGLYLAPALDRLDGYVTAGLPIVTAAPGWIYGAGSWLRSRVIDPVMSSRRVLQLGRRGPWVSPVHIHDCARALVHLAQRGEVGARYFVVDNDPVRAHEFAPAFARLANRPLRLRRLPAVAAPVVVGCVMADQLRADGVFSNIRLRGTGFRFRYPALEEGMEQVLDAVEDDPAN